MSFHVTYVRHASDTGRTVHRLRHYRGHEHEVELDCGRRFAPYDLFRLDEDDWRRDTACPGCHHHLLTLTDGENTTWHEAPDDRGHPSGAFAPLGETPDELTPMAEIVRMWGIRDLG
ncbi:hypothetical protein [Amycolatopsis minnesotensis]|uniref:Uncharacterized protein n=1 Tax=Amycolatopsis minnesotensis TaxID=337894 RepID=A0ABN2S135_9PSEU